jgi:LDH2 family malate/lactate/ureidoglycolate dehydrogenase
MVLVNRRDLEEVCSAIFQAVGFSKEEADDIGMVLTTADARGIRSHGVARIQWYLAGIKSHLIKGNAIHTILRESLVSITLDAGGAMGICVSKEYMGKVIAMAREHGIGVCSIRNSTHFGIAGFYAEMAAHQDMIGIAMTNTAAIGVPTFAREAAIGTNPIAFAVPSLDGKLFSLDMATTTVPRGKIQVYQRENKKLPQGWAVGTDGLYIDDPVELLDNMLFRRGGGLLPLGGEGELFSGYKGYGLAVLVDIMTALTSGGNWGAAVQDAKVKTSRVCHFFMAIRIDMFRPVDDFKRDVSSMLDKLSSLTPAEGAERVYYAGLKEQEAEFRSNQVGVSLEDGVWQALANTAEGFNIALPEAKRQ